MSEKYCLVCFFLPESERQNIKKTLKITWNLNVWIKVLVGPKSSKTLTIFVVDLVPIFVVGCTVFCGYQQEFGNIPEGHFTYDDV